MIFEQYHKIKRLGDDDNKGILDDPNDIIYVQEKIDGGNFRFYITAEGKIIFGSRTQQLTSNEGSDDNMAKDFRRCANYVREILKDKPLENYQGLIFYGESCHKHTITYDFEHMPPFLLFDIKILEQGKYLEQPQVQIIAETLGFTMVPLIGVFAADDEEIKQYLTEDGVPKSMYSLLSAQDQQAEGVVLKNYNKQLFAKFVRDKFKEKNAEAFGGNPKYNKVDDTDNAEIVFKYCTNQRIEKSIFKLLDEGHKLEMPLMGLLPVAVYSDIMVEEWKEIVFSKYKVDFGLMKKTVTKRCLAVLQQVMTNNALRGDD